MTDERDALIAALVQEDAAVLARRGPWRCDGTSLSASEQQQFYAGARAVLRRVAERLGVTDLHEQAGEVVARGEAGQEP